MTKFSVIVPVYNCEQYLDRCVTSLLEQVYKDFELILVDDGSTDSSSDLCDTFAKQDPRIKVIHQPNGGVTSARKAGANAATGAYIVCVDADDWVENTYLECFASVLDEYHSDIVCCEYYSSDGVNKENMHLLLEEGIYQKTDIESKIFPILIENVACRRFPSSLWAKAIRRDLFTEQQNAVDDEIRIGEDGAVVAPCVYKANSLYILKQPLYYYYSNLSSATRSRNPFPWHNPRRRGEHLEKQIDMHVADFQEQVYRMVVHALFNVAESQFNRKEKYSVIAKEIKENLKDDYYRNAIKECRFASKKGRIALVSLRCKWVLLIKMFNSLKYK